MYACMLLYMSKNKCVIASRRWRRQVYIRMYVHPFIIFQTHACISVIVHFFFKQIYDSLEELPNSVGKYIYVYIYIYTCKHIQVHVCIYI